MSRAKGKAPPISLPSGGKSSADINSEIRRLQRTMALLVCIQTAAAEGVDADLGDALAVVVRLIGESLAGLDRLDAQGGSP